MNQDYKLFAEVLQTVVNDLRQYSDGILEGNDPSEWNSRWSTYSLEAQAAVHALLFADKLIRVG